MTVWISSKGSEHQSSKSLIITIRKKKKKKAELLEAITVQTKKYKNLEKKDKNGKQSMEWEIFYHYLKVIFTKKIYEILCTKKQVYIQAVFKIWKWM